MSDSALPAAIPTAAPAAGEVQAALQRYRELGIADQLDYQRFALYSLITHSTAIEGSTITEWENQVLFEYGLTAAGKPLRDQLMNLDLNRAYAAAFQHMRQHRPLSVAVLKSWSALVMQSTGAAYSTALGNFSSSRGDLRLLNVSAGFGGQSYMNYDKVPQKLAALCEEVNNARRQVVGADELVRYRASFDAHYALVVIHPWADGNGRMARLLMHALQAEFGLVLVNVPKERKLPYIQAQQATRDADNPEIFREFCFGELLSGLRREIAAFSAREGSE